MSCSCFNKILFVPLNIIKLTKLFSTKIILVLSFHVFLFAVIKKFDIVKFIYLFIL